MEHTLGTEVISIFVDYGCCENGKGCLLSVHNTLDYDSLLSVYIPQLSFTQINSDSYLHFVLTDYTYLFLFMLTNIKTFFFFLFCICQSASPKIFQGYRSTSLM